jgi:hypothetical protein
LTPAVTLTSTGCAKVCILSSETWSIRSPCTGGPQIETATSAHISIRPSETAARKLAHPADILGHAGQSSVRQVAQHDVSAYANRVVIEDVI